MTASGHLSVIIPVKDEAATIAALIERVRAESAAVPGMRKQLVVVDDGSTDGSDEVLSRFSDGSDIVVLRHDHNLGKGAAIRTALRHCAGSIVIIQDADDEYDPDDHGALVAPIRDGRARVVYGSRFLGRGRTRPAGMAFPNWLANLILTSVADRIGPSRVTDEATCFKVFDARVLAALPLRSKRFEFCAEVTGLLQATGEPIVEVPVRYRARGFAAGKKVRPKDGFIALWWLLWCRFGRRYDRRLTARALSAGGLGP